MALVVKDRVRETSTTAGTGALTLNGAVSGFQSFSVIGDGNTTYYTIVDAGTGAWEVGIGTYTLSTTNLSRDTVLESSNSGSLVNFGSNLKDVFVTYPAERSVYTDGSAITPATASVLGVASGGTGESSYTNGELLIGNTTGNTLTKATLTAGTGISITNGTGSITVAATNNGDVVGPASSTDNAVARFDLTTGKIIQNSVVTIADSTGDIAGVGSITVGAGAVGTPSITTTGDTNTGIFFPAADTIAFARGGAEAMRITSDGEVLVGGTTPLQAAARTSLTIQNASDGSGIPELNLYRNDTSISGVNAIGSIYFYGNDTTSNTPTALAYIQAAASGTHAAGDNPTDLVFGTTADGSATVAEKMRLTGAGDVTLSGNLLPAVDNTGVVGNAANTWSNGQFTSLTVDSTLSVRAAIDLADNDILRFGSSDDWEMFHDATNNYMDLNVGDLIIRDNTTTRFTFGRTTGNIVATGSIDCGTQFLGLSTDSATAPSFSFTGDTNTGMYRPGTDQVALTTGGTARLTVTTAQFTGTLPWRGQNGTAAAPALSASADTNTGIYFPAADTIGFTEGGVEVMRVASTGRVGIGTTSPSYKLDVQDTNAVVSSRGTAGYGSFFAQGSGTNPAYLFLANATNGEQARITAANTGILAFSNTAAATERARIDASGNFMVGATAAAGKCTIQQNTAGAWTEYLINNSASGQGLGHISAFSARAPNDFTSLFYNGTDNVLSRFIVYSNGGIANYQANDINLSDRREKTNFAPAKNYLETICSIPVQTFTYIDQAEDDPDLTLGVVAQDVQAVAPELVKESDWSAEKDGSKMRLSIYQTDLQYALMKSIQELKAELDTVKAELATLKGN